jgi:predicted nucleotidyltransferase
MSQPVITRFDKIKNLAVFKDFKWDLYTKDKNRNILGFARVNIIYGRNYSGKTTLSRIVRALETGFLSDKYINPEFEVLFEGGLKVDQNTLKGHNFLIRVFNEDFVKENLRFVFDENQGVNSFAILGENNTKIEDEIRLLEMQLGSDLEGRGLMYELSQHEKVLVSAKENHALVSESLDKRLRDKANKNESGIKHNKIFGNANYNIEKIKSDIDFIVNHKSNQLNENEIHDLCETLKDHKKDMISDKSTFNFSYDSLSLEARGLIERKIKISQPIQELLNNNLLE